MRNWFRAHPEPGDILFVTKGTPGRTCLVPDPVDFCIAQDMVAVRADEARIVPSFLFAILRSEDVQQQIKGMHVGTMIPHFKKGDFDQLLIPLPERRTQSAIGELHMMLLQKIETNRRQSRILESIATMLFRSWFVDFEPVLAKLDGRTAVGVPAAAMRLFPARFEDSEVGPIPNGWNVVQLAECGTWVSGGTPSKQNPRFWGGTIPWISAKSLRTFFLEDSEDRVTPEGTENGTPVVPAGTVLFLVRGMSLANEFRFGIAACDLTFNQDTKAIIPREDIDGLLIALLLAHEAETVLGMVDDTTHGTKRLQTELVESLKLVLPPKPLRNELVAVLKPLAERQLRNQRENRTLAALRDALLPALLSGEITLKDAEKTVAKVV